MQANKVIRATTQDCSISLRGVSRAMNRSESFLANYLSTGRIPNLELMAEIADATGHDLIVRNRDTGLEILIDPPER